MAANWTPPENAEGWISPGFAKQWDFQASASQNGGGLPELGNMMNWATIPGLPQGMFKPAQMGDIAGVDNYVLDDWLSANGYQIKQSGAGGDVGYRWIEDGSGNVIGEPSAFSKGTDKTFLAGALAAGAIAGGGILAANGVGTTGGGLSGMDLAADAALGTGNNITTAGGLLSAAPAAAAPAAAAPATGATNPALIESAVGTPGYGASSAGAGGGAGALATGLPSWVPDGLAPAWDFIKGNPKLIGALAGGLLGGVGSGGEETPASYTGPMPTITRGNWNADNRAAYKPMQMTQYGGGLLSTPGTKQAGSGLHQYMGLLGRG